MGKFDGVLLVSDYDDTLYSGSFSVSEKNRVAIRYFIANGGHFTVATGRAHTTFAPQVVKEQIPMNAPAILSNGSAIYDFSAHKMIYQTFLCPETMMRLELLVRDIPQVAFEAYHGEDIYIYNPNEVTRAHLERVGVGGTECPIGDMPVPWTKVILEQTHAVLEQTQDYILSRWGSQYEAIFSNRHLLELTDKGSTKGDMVLWLADYLKISREHIYCVGDSPNDISMLAVSAVPFACGNCTDEVANWGATLVNSCDESCIAQIIGILDQRYH
ncbi:5-amino-6-(5-phospho-D-ribitylamino)uracil phosphatase YwtE [bioreactor metagenome]|uniref:5-amino-6-(5-phospho-D-ribitylamino)uracil phosphatase YwtE n=1 Tax=bioreactor metagenome TaxID=1076179 RepID=A0A644YAF6_9ZZZZ